jgi:hypothetical protein
MYVRELGPNGEVPNRLTAVVLTILLDTLQLSAIGCSPPCRLGRQVPPQQLGSEGNPMRHVCAFLLFCLTVSGLSSAQDSRADLFGGYSYLNIDTNGLSSRQSASGWEASVSSNFNKWFAAEAAVSGYYKSYDVLGINVAVRDYSYVAGPRVNFKPLFVHALVGGDHLSAGALGASASQDGLAGAFGGGLQWRFSRQLSFRTSADYVFSRHNILGGSSVTQNNFRVSVGIVYGFGTVRAVSTEPHQETARAPSAGMRISALGIMASAGSSQGAEVTNEVSNSAAALGGIHVGDVINAVDGMSVKSPAELATALSGLASGSKVRIGFMIRGQWQSETVVSIAENH